MPTYEYQCRTCESRFDVVQSFADAALAVCPQVGDSATPVECVSPGEGVVKKVFSVPAITFKGDGFYKTDSRKAARKVSSVSGSNGDSGVVSDAMTGSETGSSDVGSGDTGSSGDGSSKDSSKNNSKNNNGGSKRGIEKSVSKSSSDSKKAPASV